MTPDPVQPAPSWPPTRPAVGWQEVTLMRPSADAFLRVPNGGHPPGAGEAIFSGLDSALLRFVAEMYAVQLDQLAALLADWGEEGDESSGNVRRRVSRWRAAGYVETGQLSAGEPWIWGTRKGLDAFGIRVKLAKPSPRLLRHAHAVTELRLALQRTTALREGGAWWRGERSILAGQGYLPGVHPPDGEVHWPAGTASPWAGETWAVEVEISPKSVSRTVAIMQETLTQVGNYGEPGGSVNVPGLQPRYARLVYVCSAGAVRTVLSARAEVGSHLSTRIDVHDLPVPAHRQNALKRGWQA